MADSANKRKGRVTFALFLKKSEFVGHRNRRRLLLVVARSVKRFVILRVRMLDADGGIIVDSCIEAELDRARDLVVNRLDAVFRGMVVV